MKKHIHWFRSDLRLHDQPGLKWAMGADQYLGVYILDPLAFSVVECAGSSFRRMDLKRLTWLRMHLVALQQEHRKRGSELQVYVGDPVRIFSRLKDELGAVNITATKEWAPEEIASERALEQAGIAIHYSDTGGLFALEELLQIPEKQRRSFTPFRQFVEQQKWSLRASISELPEVFPPVIPVKSGTLKMAQDRWKDGPTFPFSGGVWSGRQRLRDYLQPGKIDRYKETRNGLIGADFSSKFSPWLSLGSLTAVEIVEEVRAFERVHGVSDGTYWMWFELLWREFFRMQLAIHGSRMFQMGGITGKYQLVRPDREQFDAWCRGETASDFVNAGMIELRQTGFLSNRMRQICASYLIHELQQDWRWGAAWFEAHLLDYDVHSNYGNWAYIAGAGNDPRGGRHFSIQKQQEIYDADGAYTRYWKDQTNVR